MQFAPFELRTAWTQNAVRIVLEGWQDEEPGAFEVLMSDEETYGIAVEYEIRPLHADTDYVIEPRVDEHVLEEPPGDVDRGLAERLAEEWVAEIERVVAAHQERTTLSPKEFATLLIMRSDGGTESRAAAILDVEPGTIRGKMGRVREKFDMAAATAELDRETDLDNRTEQASTAAARFSDLVNADRGDLPLDEPVEQHGT